MSRTDGLRLYVIGDIHGEIAKLVEIHERIEADLSRRPGRTHAVIHLGDYVDRGADSRAVIAFLISGVAAKKPWLTLYGNHDRYLVKYVTEPGWEDPHTADRLPWLDEKLGGIATLRSYGVDVPEMVLPEERFDWQAAARERVPRSHVEFLSRCRRMIPIGDYLFVHAGIRPGISLDAQKEQDLLWIRGDFLSHSRSFGPVVVHGHTVVRQVTRYRNRIAVDTGAVFGGELSCVVLDGPEVGLLTREGTVPLRRKRRWSMF